MKCEVAGCPVQTPRRLCYFHADGPRRSSAGLRFCSRCRRWVAWDDNCCRNAPRSIEYRRAYKREWQRRKRAAA